MMNFSVKHCTGCVASVVAERNIANAHVSLRRVKNTGKRKDVGTRTHVNPSPEQITRRSHGPSFLLIQLEEDVLNSLRCWGDAWTNGGGGNERQTQATPYRWTCHIDKRTVKDKCVRNGFMLIWLSSVCIDWDCCNIRVKKNEKRHLKAWEWASFWSRYCYWTSGQFLFLSERGRYTTKLVAVCPLPSRRLLHPTANSWMT